jgi:hypothetical protein
MSPRRKPGTEGLNNFRTPAAFLDPAIATVQYTTATHYRYANLTFIEIV